MISFAKFKNIFIYAFVGSLIISALVAITTVLTGSFSEVTSRVFLSLFMVVVHSLISLFFIWDDSRHNTFTKLAFFMNTLFVIVILSFVTSLFGVWKILSPEIIGHIYYQVYFLIACGAFHADMLSKASHKEKYIDGVIYANYAFIAIIIAMFMPIIFVDNYENVLGEMYLRSFAAVGIIDGTLSILTIIFYKLYMFRHPEIKEKIEVNGTNKGFNVLSWILRICVLFFVIYLIIQISIPVLFLFGISQLFHH